MKTGNHGLTNLLPLCIINDWIYAPDENGKGAVIVHFRLDGAAVYHGGKLMRADVSVDGGRIASVSNLHEADALPLGG